MNDIWWLDDYETILNGVGSIELPNWSRIELRGKDRGKLLNSLGTNRLDDMSPGQGRETFLTDAKGHVVAHGIVLSGEESTSFVTAGSQGNTIAAHFNRYIVREDVEVANRSVQTAMWYLGGSQAGPFLEYVGVPVPQAPGGHVAADLDGASLTLCRVEMAGPTGFLLVASRDQARGVARALEQAGAKSCVREAFEAARIQWGWPLDRVDISLDNFPQEVGRDDEAISFTKGCYLGQETISRIDSRGHVNKRLAVVRFAGAKLASAAALSFEGRPIGNTTSMGYSPEFGCPVALAYLRREWAEPGAILDSPLGQAEICTSRRLASASGSNA